MANLKDVSDLQAVTARSNVTRVYLVIETARTTPDGIIPDKSEVELHASDDHEIVFEYDQANSDNGEADVLFSAHKRLRK